MIAIEAGYTLPAISTGTTVWCVSITARIVALIARLTRTTHTLASPNLITISVSNTANALAPIGDADWRRPTASGVIAWIAGGTDGIDALLAVTIAIAETSHALTAVGYTDGGIPTAAGVIICPIADLALLTNTL
jgi:hypothetical protein